MTLMTGVVRNSTFKKMQHFNTVIIIINNYSINYIISYFLLTFRWLQFISSNMGNTTSSVSSNHNSSHCNNSTLGRYKVPDCKYRREEEREEGE